MHTKESRAKIAAAARRQWAVPSIRARMVRGLKESQARQEVRDKIGAGVRAAAARRKAEAARAAQ